MGRGINKIVGIDGNWVFDAFIGVVLAVAFYVIGNIFNIVGAIGVPSLPSSIVSDVGAFIIIVIGASIFETVLFQDILLDFFDSKLKLNFIFSATLSSLAFSLFHVYVYGQSLTSSGGGLVSAFVVGMLFCTLRYYTDSIMSVMTAHGTLNFIIEFIVRRNWITI